MKKQSSVYSSKTNIRITKISSLNAMKTAVIMKIMYQLQERLIRVNIPGQDTYIFMKHNNIYQSNLSLEVVSSY